MQGVRQIDIADGLVFDYALDWSFVVGGQRMHTTGMYEDKEHSFERGRFCVDFQISLSECHLRDPTHAGPFPFFLRCAHFQIYNLKNS